MNAPSKLRIARVTLVGAIGMTVLYALPPAAAVVLAGVDVPAGWFWTGVGAAAVFFWALLFTLAVREAGERLPLPG